MSLESLPFLVPLDAQQRAAAGVPPEFRYAIADRVRFHDLDALGHVNNARYLSWFEAFRLPYLRDYGVTRYDAESPRLVLATVSLDFHAEMFLGEAYAIAGRTLWFRTSSFEMEYAVFAPDRRVTGRAVIVLRTPDGRAKWPLTEENRATLRHRDSARALP
ncbi:MAG: acyl-CoA thioesterase [Alphaproteobacteria bacterium]|nr:MAG: acyl-CoA thioesterase [Alphaproteobacteria bacterium]